MAEQSFSSFFAPQEEDLHDDKKRTTTTIAKETTVEPRQYEHQRAIEIYPY